MQRVIAANENQPVFRNYNVAIKWREDIGLFCKSEIDKKRICGWRFCAANPRFRQPIFAIARGSDGSESGYAFQILFGDAVF